MRSLRRFLETRRALGGLVVALALTLKLLVPAGFMPGVADGRIVIELCTGSGPVAMAIPIRNDAPGETGKHHKPEAPCAFSALSTPHLAAADPLVLAALLLFIMALGTRAHAPPPACASPRLRPPLRGPPRLD